MKITIESTEQMTEFRPSVGASLVPARVWVGTTESGIPVALLIARIAVPESAGHRAHQAFEAEMGKPHRPPQDIGVQAFPARMIL